MALRITVDNQYGLRAAYDVIKTLDPFVTAVEEV